MQNQTNGSNSSSTLIEMPPWVDYSFRILFLVVHLAYFLVVAVFRDLQKISLIHMHHTNLIGLLSGIHYCIWIAWGQPATGNPIADDILCHISEIFWSTSKTARCYSILVLAIYRLIAVYRINLFKQIVKSMRVYLISIFMVWFIPALIFILAEFTSHAQPGYIICYDGYSPIIIRSVIYFVITSILGYFIPATLIIIIYIFIRMKLDTVGNKLTSPANLKVIQSNHFFDESFTDYSIPKIRNSSSYSTKVMLAKKDKERRLAKQFIVINGFEIASCVFLVLLSSSNVITIFTVKYYFARQLFRIGNLICQTFIPIASLVYSPVYRKAKNFIRSSI